MGIHTPDRWSICQRVTVKASLLSYLWLRQDYLHHQGANNVY